MGRGFGVDGVVVGEKLGQRENTAAGASAGGGYPRVTEDAKVTMVRHPVLPVALTTLLQVHVQVLLSGPPCGIMAHNPRAACGTVGLSHASGYFH